MPLEMRRGEGIGGTKEVDGCGCDGGLLIAGGGPGGGPGGRAGGGVSLFPIVM